MRGTTSPSPRGTGMHRPARGAVLAILLSAGATTSIPPSRGIGASRPCPPGRGPRRKTGSGSAVGATRRTMPSRGDASRVSESHHRSAPDPRHHPATGLDPLPRHRPAGARATGISDPLRTVALTRSSAVAPRRQDPQTGRKPRNESLTSWTTVLAEAAARRHTHVHSPRSGRL